MNSQLIYENRFQINKDISNRKLQKLCRYYKSYYSKNNKEITIKKLQYILNKKRKILKEYKINNCEECVICYKMLTDKMLITRCLHAYCDNCIVSYLNLYSMNCPICRHYCDSNWFIEDKQIKEEELNNFIIEHSIIEDSIPDTSSDIVETEREILDHYLYLYHIYNFIYRYRTCIAYLIVLMLMNNLFYLHHD
jgi:hypothetical protein